MHQAKQVNPGWGGALRRARVGRWCRRVAATACVAALSACGGGGSSSPAPVEHSRVIVSTLAVHDANGQPVTFSSLGSIVRDPSTGNLYVSDRPANRIYMVQPDGLTTLVAGSASGVLGGTTDGSGNIAQFHYPMGLALDADGALYVADGYNQTIRKLVNSGDKSRPEDWTVTTFAGSVGQYGYRDTAAGDPPTQAQFKAPAAVAVDTNANVLYVGDGLNYLIRKIDLSSPLGAVSTLAGTPGVFGAADTQNGSAATFNQPRQITIDPHGDLYVDDYGGLRHVSAATGEVHTIRAVRGVYTPDSAGDFYFLDGNSGRIVSLIKPNGQESILAGSDAELAHVDGTGDVARMSSLSDMVLDEAHKTLYVIEAGNPVSPSDIRKIVLP